MPIEKLMRIAWPSFLAACVLELLVFAVVDPMDLEWSGHPLAWSRQAIYTLGFFVFWAVTTASNALTVLLGMPSGQVNQGAIGAEVPDDDAG